MDFPKTATGDRLVISALAFGWVCKKLFTVWLARNFACA